MSDTIVFHALNRKFLQREADMPEDAAACQVLYQTLALGHHIGVIDCLNTVLRCDADAYAAFVGTLREGEARRKLDGVLRWGEILIDATHVDMLANALDEAQGRMTPAQAEWHAVIMNRLAAIAVEPAMYLMVKRHVQ